MVLGFSPELKRRLENRGHRAKRGRRDERPGFGKADFAGATALAVFGSLL